MVMIPEMHVAVLAGVFHPVGLAGLVAALVVVVAGGLCLAIAVEGGVRREWPGLAGREREGVAAA
jgi:hypothetical protein